MRDCDLRLWVAGAVVLATSLLSGCSLNSGVDSVEGPDSPVSAEQTSVGDPALLVEYRSAVDAQVECLRRLGYEVSTSKTDEQVLQVGAILPPEVTPEDEAVYEEWSATYDQHRQQCAVDAGVADAEAEYLATLWVDGSQREALWADFVVCVEEAGLPVPPRGLSEEGVNDVLLSEGDDEVTMQSLLECRAETSGLWPSLTRRGDTKTTIIIA